MSLQAYYYDYLTHHGVKGMKWGVRRYQYEDGSLTEKGKKRYAKQLSKDMNAYEKRAARAYGDAESNLEYYDRYHRKYLRADSKGRDKKAQKYLQKRDVYDKRANDLLDKFNADKAQIDKVKEFMSKNSDFIVTYKRGTTVASTTPDGATLSVDYDKTKIRLNNEKNNKKYSNKKKERGYGLTKTWVYYT